VQFLSGCTEAPFSLEPVASLAMMDLISQGNILNHLASYDLANFMARNHDVVVVTLNYRTNGELNSSQMLKVQRNNDVLNSTFE
jgi:hypothetical protein